MRRFTRILGLLVVLVVLGSVPAAAALIGPGSGTATVTPLTATVAAPGTWTVVYSAEDNFTNGTLRLTIPSGWTAPQKTSAGSPGYVTVVTDGPILNPPFTIAANVITVDLADLPKPKIVTLVYGDTNGGANPGAKATPPTTSNPAALFLVESDPTGPAVAPIAASPTVNLQPGPIVDLEFTGAPFAFPTTGEGGPYSVVARDTYNNSSPVTANQQIDLATTSGAGIFSVLGGGGFSPVASVTMTAGTHTVTFYYRDTFTGSPTLSASGNGRSWTTATQGQTVNPGPPDVLELSPPNATIPADSYLTLTIDVVDAYGNPTDLLENRNFLLASSSSAAQGAGMAAPTADPLGQFYLPGDHGTPITTLPMTAGQQTAQVDYRSTDANDGVPHHIIILSETPSMLSGLADVTVQPGSIDESASLVTAISPVVADGSPSTVTVTVTDQWGNPKAGVNVALGCTGNANHTNPAGPTGANGVATGTVTDTKAEGVTVSATANGNTLVDTAPVLFVPGSATQIEIVSGNGQSAQVDQWVPSDLVVRVRDEFNNLVEGENVTFDNLTGGGSVDVDGLGPLSNVATTGSNGEARCDEWRLGQTVGPNTVTARIGAGANVVFSASSTPGPGDTIVLAPPSGNVPVGTTIQVDATLEDEFGNPVPGVLLTIVISDAADGALENNPASPTTGGTTSRQGTTDANGKIGVFYRASATAGRSDTIDATGGSLGYGDVVDVVFTSIAGGATKLRISGLTPTTQNAGSTFSFTIEALDGNNNLVTTNTSTVNLTTEGGSGLEFNLNADWSGPLVTQVTLAGGQKDVYGRGYTADTWTFTVDDAGPLTPDSDDIQITSALDIDHYDVTESTGSVTAGVNFNVTVTARDQWGNRVTTASNSVNLDPVDPGTNNVVTPALSVPSAVLASGQVVVVESYTKAWPIKVRARDASLNEGYSGVIQVTPAGAHHIVRVSGDLNGIVAGDTVPHEAEVRDLYENPVSGATVSFSILEGGGSVNPSSAPTNGVGRVTVNRTTGTTVGLNRTRAQILDGNPAGLERVEWSVQTVAGSAIDHYDFTLPKTTWTAHELVSVKVQAYDVNDNPVNDNTTTVQLTSTTGNAQYTAPSGQLSGGIFSTTARDDVAETLRLIVTTGGGEPKDTSDVVTVTHAAAYQVVKVSGDATVTVGDIQPLVVAVQDAYTNTVDNEPVTYNILSSPAGATLDPSGGIVTTGSDGQASVDLHTSTTAGTHSVRARIGDGNPSNLETKTFTVSTVADVATKLRISGLAPTTQNAGSTFSFTIEALDGNNNLVTTNTSTVNLTTEGGSGLEFNLNADWSGPLVTQVTLAGGQKDVYGRGYTADTWTFTVDDAGPLAPDSDDIQITSALAIDRYDVTESTGSVTAGVNFNVTVTARDQWGNRVTTASNSVNLDPVDPGTNNVVTPALSVPSAALASGQVVVVESYTKAWPIKVRARDASLNVGYSGVIQVTPGVAHHIVRVSGDLNGIVAGNPVEHEAVVQDLYDNPVQGQTVSFSILEGGGSVNPSSAPTEADGHVTVNRTTGTTVGLNRTRAQILDGNPANLERVEWSVQTVASSAIDHYRFIVPPTWTAHELVSVKVQAYDVNDNPVNDNTTTVQLTSTTGNAQYTAPSGQLSGGIFSTTARDDVAETLRLIVSTGGGEPKDTSEVVTVTHAAAYQVVKVSGDATVTVGATQPLVVEVQDAYTNTVDNEMVTFNILSSPTGATLDPSDGIVFTGSNGRTSVDLHTSTTAGTHSVRARILDGSPSNLETKTFTVTTVAGGIDHYEVIPVATERLAGAALNFTVTALDRDNNVVNDDATVVALSLAKGSGAVFSENPVTLVDGTFTRSVTCTLAQVIQIRAQTQGIPVVFGLSPDITIRPNVAYGPITATAAPDTITANGSRQSTIASNAIEDQYGNTVSQGTLIDVDTDLGTILSGDQDLVRAGIQRATDSQGEITVVVGSGTTWGTATVSMDAVPPGTATGTRQIVFAQPPVMANAGAPTPGVVTPGETVFFTVSIQNNSPTAVWLSTGSTMSFTDGPDTYAASLAATTFVAGPGSNNLVFQSELVPDGMDPIRYTPTLSLTGTDEYGATFTTNLSLPVNSLSVTAIEIVDIVPASSVVSLDQHQNITVKVKNKGPITATITAVNFTFEAGNQHFDYQPLLSPSVNVPAGAIVPIIVDVHVLQAAPVGTTTIDAEVIGTVGGTAVSDPSLEPYFPLPTWDIRSGADITYVAGTLTPVIVSRGKTYGFKVQLKNNGDATVELKTPGTKLSFTDGPTTYQPALTQNETLGAGVTKEIAFIATQIPNAITADRTYNVKLHIEGQENFVDFPPFDLFTGAVGDSVTVLLPANVVYVPGSLNPQLVTRTVSSSFEIKVNNLGTAEVELTPGSTTFSFAGYGPATLDPGQTTVSSDTTTLRFTSQVVTSTAGVYTPQVLLVGMENTQPFTPPNFSTAPDQVTVQDPANISIVSIEPSQAAITANQQKSITVTMTVTSAQPVAINFKNASLKFMLNGSQDLTSRFTITPPTGFVTHGASLPGNTTDSLRFTISDNAINNMAEGNYVVEGNLCVTDAIGGQDICVDTDGGGKGNLLVQSPGVLDITGITASQNSVTTNQTQPWTVGMTVKNVGSGVFVADVRLVLALDRVAPFDSTSVSFDLGSGWVRTLQTTGLIDLGKNEETTIVFNVTRAGDTPGAATINGTVRGVELNSDDVKIDQTPTGAGTVTVQTPANLRITQIVKSRDPVTEGQTTPWTITVTVANDGEAEVLVSKVRRQTYIAFPDAVPPDTIGPPAGDARLPGKQQRDLTFTVSPTPSFGGVSGQQPFDVHVAATETNRDTTFTQTAAENVLVELEPSPTFVPPLDPSSVKLGDVAIFKIHLSEIVGASLVELDTNSTRLRFTDGANYVRPFLDGSKNTRIFPGVENTLQFEEATVPTGFAQGTFAVYIELHGKENGNAFDLILGPTDGVDNVDIRPSSTARIIELIASQNAVTKGQDSTWTVTMVVENTGDAPIEVQNENQTTLNMSIAGFGDRTNEYQFDPASTFTNSGTDTLPVGAIDSLVFMVTKTGVTTGSLRVDGTFFGIDVESKKEVRDNTSDGGWADLVVQTPASLSVAAFISGPLDATDGTVSAGQTFTVRADVTNAGQASVDDKGGVTIRVPDGFAVSDTTKGLTIGQAVLWEVTAPPTYPHLDQVIEVAITQVPNEVNTRGPALVTKGADSILVDVLEPAAFTSAELDVFSPDGVVKDSTASTDQRFFIQASVVAKTTTKEIKATLQILTGTVTMNDLVPQDTVQIIGLGTGVEQSVVWRVDAPSVTDSIAFRVRFDGRDENSPETPRAWTFVLPVKVVPKTRLTLNYEIISDEAKDGIVAIGAPFDIEATVDNALNAAGIDPLAVTPIVSIDLTEAPGYTLVSGLEDEVFEIGTPIPWTIRAPDEADPVIRYIRLFIKGVPVDENSGLPAVVVVGQRRIGVSTESTFVTADNISARLGLDTKVVPKGTSDIDMLGVELANTNEAIGSARVDSIAVSVLTGSGSLAGSPSGTLGEFYAVVNGYRVNGSLSQNPVVFDFTAVPGRVILDPAGAATDSIVFTVSVLSNAALDEIVLSIENADDIVVRSTHLPFNRVPVVDKTTSGSITGRLRSQPLVILSNNFEEYAHNYPNPFRAGSELTRIAYVLENDAPVGVRIYAITGELVYRHEYARGEQGTNAGPQEVTWDGRNSKGEVVRNGIYICQLEAGGRSVKIRIAVAK